MLKFFNYDKLPRIVAILTCVTSLNIVGQTLPKLSKNQRKPLLKSTVSEFNINGNVYFDENKNNNFEASEFGVGGIEVLVSDEDKSKVILTDKNGKFNFLFKSKRNKVIVQLINNSLPGGASIIGANEYSLNNASGFNHDLIFGINYPEQEIEFYFNRPIEKEVSIIEKLKSNATTTISISVEGDDLYIDDNKWKKVFKNNKKSFFQSSYNTYFNPINLKMSKVDSLIRKITIYDFKTEKIKISFKYPKQEKRIERKIEILKEEVRLKLIQAGIDKKKIVFSDVQSDHYQIEFKIQNKKDRSCFVLVGKKSYEVLIGKPIEIAIPKRFYSKIKFSCENSLYPYKIEAGELFVDESSTKGTAKLILAKYFSDHRDRNLFFRLETEGISKARFNHHAFKSATSIVESLEAGDYKFDLKLQNYEGEEKRFNFPLTVFPKSKFMAQVDYGMRNQNNTSDIFSSSYSIDEVTYLKIKAKYFYSYQYGIFASADIDTLSTALSTNTGGVALGDNYEFATHFIWRKLKNSKLFNTLEYQYLLGLNYKLFDFGDESVRQLYPENYLGIQAGIELIKNEFILREYSLQTKILIGAQITEVSNFSYEIHQEFILNLNSLGYILPVKSYFSHYRRYDYIKRLSAVFGIHYAYYTRTTLNSIEGTLNQSMLSATVGIKLLY